MCMCVGRAYVSMYVCTGVHAKMTKIYPHLLKVLSKIHIGL